MAKKPTKRRKAQPPMPAPPALPQQAALSRELPATWVRLHDDPWWNADAVDLSALPAATSGDVATLPQEVWHIITSVIRQVVADQPKKQRAVIDSRNPVVRAAAAGFLAALHRYRDQLAKVPELHSLYARRKEGGDKGRAVSSLKKDDLAQRIRDIWAAMEAAGETPTNASVAAAIQKECGRGSVSTVIRAFRDKPAKKTNR
jgi:hypothetical protein